MGFEICVSTYLPLIRTEKFPLWFVLIIASLDFSASQLENKAINSSLSSIVPSNRRSSHRDPNILAALQQIQLQLNMLETESQRQTSRMQELTRVVGRLEIQKQDIVSMLDRFEGRISQRLDDIKGDGRKIITLQEVFRDDLDKVQQNQLVNKVWLEQQIQHLNRVNVQDNARIQVDTKTLVGGTDLLSNMQILQTSMYSLRRMADTLQMSIGTLMNNITHLTNFTRNISDHLNSNAVTKTYLQSSLQALASETQDNQYTGCVMVGALQNQEEEHLPHDCQEVQKKVRNTTGIYRIQPKYAQKPIFVYCDMESQGGGWTVIQRRQDGSVDFLRGWNDYKHGFGNVAGEFWLGNENLHLITHQGIYELRVDLQDFEGGQASSNYAAFAIGNEKERYMLKLLGPLISGEAGDGLSYHASLPFSTIDMDNDRWEGGNCAKDHTGGWWYNQCDASNLNGQYLAGLTVQEYKGVYWHEWQGPNYSLMNTQMMIRPVHYLTKINYTATKAETTIDASTTETSPNTTPVYWTDYKEAEASDDYAISIDF